MIGPNPIKEAFALELTKEFLTWLEERRYILVLRFRMALDQEFLLMSASVAQRLLSKLSSLRTRVGPHPLRVPDGVPLEKTPVIGR